MSYFQYVGNGLGDQVETFRDFSGGLGMDHVDNEFQFGTGGRGLFIFRLKLSEEF